MIKFAYDFVCLFVIVVCIWQSYRRGFAASLVNFCGKVIALVGAYAMSAPLAQWIYTRFIEADMVSGIAQNLQLATDEAGAFLIGGAEIITLLNTYFSSTKMPFSSYFINNLNNSTQTIHDSVSAGAQVMAQNVADSVCKPVIVGIFAAAAVILLFVIFSLIIGGLVKALQVVNKIPLIGGVNKLLGGIFGVLVALMILYMIAIGIRLFVGLTNQNLPILSDTTIGKTYLFKYIYHFTPFQ